jgi:predicted RNA-binding protein
MDGWHLAKEFLIIGVIIFTSIIFYESFFYGVRLKGKLISNKETFMKEANTYNRAMAFIPKSEADYFVLNKCGKKDQPYNPLPVTIHMDEMANRRYSIDTTELKIQEALKRPDAFSFRNYCINKFSGNAFPIQPDSLNNLENTKLINAGDSIQIKKLLEALAFICKKYDIEQHLDLGSLIHNALKPLTRNNLELVPNGSIEYINGHDVQNEYYFNNYDLEKVLDFMDECHDPRSLNTLDSMIISLYVALSMAIILFCYRRFSKKVFLISFVGSIVITILVSLFGLVSGSESSSLWFLLLLFILFTLLGLAILKQKTSKTVAGVLLNWHIYVLPFLAFILVGLISSYYNDLSNFDRFGTYMTDIMMQKKYPISFWVVKHTSLIFRVNTLFSIGYVTFVFNRLAKKWHTVPDE